MTEANWQAEALIEGVKAEYDMDGSLRDENSIVVKVNYVEKDEMVFDPDEIDDEEEVAELSERYEPGETITTDYRNGAYARVRFDVGSNGVARVSSFKDVSPEDAGWMSFEFLRAVQAAARVAANVPGVDRVEDPPATISTHLMNGEAAEIRRA